MPDQSLIRACLYGCITTIALAALASPAAAQAQTDPNAARPQIDASAAQTLEPAADGPEIVIVHLRTSQIVRAPWPVKRVSLTDPEIADVQVLTPKQLLLQGKKLGTTDLILWSEQEETLQATIRVQVDLERIQGDLRGLFPRSTLTVAQPQEDFLVVRGELAQAEHAKQLAQYLKAYGVKHVDMTSVGGVQQVMLKVRLAEVSRSAIRTLGFNAFVGDSDFVGGINVGSASGGGINPTSIGVPAGTVATNGVPFVFTSTTSVSPLVTLFAGFPDWDMEMFLQALAENQYLRILAEPNLVALSGEQAGFLAGGEFPIPVVQGADAAGTSVTVEYKEFGVRLEFLPKVLGNGKIRLYVAPEVSDISDVGAVDVAGFRIPALVTRKTETTLELNSGQTFAMAGLINQTTRARSSRVPGIGDVPVLGTLFRSTRYEQGETDLVVLVTASLVEPESRAGDAPLPGDLYETPNEWEFYATGAIEGERTGDPPAKAKWLREAGLDRLKGPGAWETYQQKMTR